MLNRIQTTIRLLIVGLLIYPMPIAMAEQITTYEDFENSSWEYATITSNNSSVDSYTNAYDTQYGCTNYCLVYSFNTSNSSITVDWSDDYVEEIGFIVGGVNATFTLKYYYTDNTTALTGYTFNNNTGSGWSDYNINFTVGDSGKFIDKIEIIFSAQDVVLFDNFYWTYDSTTSATTTTTTTTVPLTIGAPTNQTATVDYENGTVTIDWDAPTDGNTSPERYAIGFGLNDEGTASPYGIATGNVGDENALNTEYTFTASYIESIFNEAHGLFNTAIRSDNDTNSLYSSWTSTISTTIQNKPAKVSNLDSSIDNSGDNLTITWDANDNGFVSASNYKIFSKTNETEWTQVLVTTNTSYSFKATETNSWEFRVDACGSEGDCNSSSTNVTFNYTVPTTTTTTTTTTLPPPPPTTTTTTLPPVEVVIMDDGTEAEYTQDQIAQGDVQRDNERKANEEKWGCYVTNIALERGDCEAYNKALYESTTTTTIIEEEIKDEEVIKEDFETEPTDDIIIVDNETKEVKEDVPVEEIVEEKDVEPIENVPTDGDVVEDVLDTPTESKEEAILPEVLPEDDKQPIKESEEIVDELEDEFLDKDLPIEDKTEDAKFVENIVSEVIVVEDIVKEGLNEEELIQAEKEFEAKVAEAVEVLPTEEKVKIVQEVAKVEVKNLATADNKTKAVVKAVVKEVTKVETVAQLSEEEKKDVGKVLGFQDETAAKDIEIVAVQASKEENVAKAVDEFVDRAIENKDVENYTLADVVTEVQVEAFLEDPVSAIMDVDFDNIDFSNIGNDMTSDQKEKAQEVVVPVIIASQIIAQAGALIRRPF